MTNYLRTYKERIKDPFTGENVVSHIYIIIIKLLNVKNIFTQPVKNCV